MRIIKRYSNRKLYDTATRTYITLDQIGELVVAGQEIRVVDNDSDEDITTVILSQLLLERERSQRFLPTTFLSQLLRSTVSSGGKLGELIRGKPVLNLLEQEIERSFKFWLDLAEGGEEEVLKFLERLIEQRRRVRAGLPEVASPRRRKVRTGLDNFEEWHEKGESQNRAE